MPQSSATFTLFCLPDIFSFSPWIHKNFAQQCHVSLNYTLTQIAPGTLAQAIALFRQQGGMGANVTMPFKQEAFSACQALCPRAQEARSVNTLFWQQDTLWGDNTDGEGLVQDITVNHGYSLQDKTICLLGAGGVSAGIISALLGQGVAKILLCNRTLARAISLAQRFSHKQGAIEVIPIELLPDIHQRYAIDWIIKATPTFMLPSGLATDKLVYDVAYNTIDTTEFVIDAKAQGATHAFDGLGMLVEQAACSFKLWYKDTYPQTRSVIERLRTITQKC